MDELPSHEDPTLPSQQSPEQPVSSQPATSFLYVKAPKSESVPTRRFESAESEFQRLMRQSNDPSDAATKQFFSRLVPVPMWAVCAVAIVLLISTCGWFNAMAASGQSTSSNHTNSVVLVNTATPTLVPTITPTSGPTPTPFPTATPAPTDTPEPTPTPTPAPTWHTVNHFSGSVNQQTDTISIPDGAHIVWSYQITDSANFFALDLYSSDGTLVDQLANYANESSGHNSTYAVHGDGDYYLNIQADNTNWTVNVQVYE